MKKYTLVSRKSGSENSEYYPALSIGNKLYNFHNYITKFEMVDHINKNPMDNRLENLRKADHKINNNNRSLNKKGTISNILGVKFDIRTNSFIGRIKQDGKEYSKSFSIKKYGYEEEKEYAIEFRKEMNDKFNCTNS